MNRLDWCGFPIFSRDREAARFRTACKQGFALARTKLSPVEPTLRIARRKGVRDEMKATEDESGGNSVPTSLSDERKKSPQHEINFAAEVAEMTDVTKRDVNKKLRRVEVLGDSTKEIVGTSLDSGVEMDALIKMEEPARCRFDCAGRASTVTPDAMENSKEFLVSDNVH